MCDCKLHLYKQLWRRRLYTARALVQCGNEELMRILLVASLLLVQALALGQPLSSTQFIVTGDVGNPGETVVVDVLIDQTLDPGAGGLSFGICNNPGELTIVDFVPDDFWLTVNDGEIVDLLSFGVTDDGAATGVIVGFQPTEFLAPGLYDAYDLHVRLDGVPGSAAHLSFCDTVGEPPVQTLVVDAFGNTFLPQTVVEDIQINGLCQQQQFVQAGARAVATDGETLLIGRAGEAGSPAAVSEFYSYSQLPNGDWVLDQTIPSPTGGGAQFAFSVAVDGDLAVIGVPFVSLVYVYVRDNGSWVLEQSIDGTGIDGFGQALAVTDQIIVIGAPGADVAGLDTGAIFIYYRQNNGSLSAPIEFSGVTGDNLGTAVDIQGGLPGEEAVVAASSVIAASNGTPLAGTVSLFRGTPGSWLFEQTVHSPNPITNGRFGNSVKLSPDASRVLIGAPDETSTAPIAGAAYFYRFNSPTLTWDFEQQILAPPGDSQSRFGARVALEQDHAVVSASVPGSAAHYFYARGGNTWGFTERYLPTSPAGVVDALDSANGVGFSLSGFDLNTFSVPFADCNDNGIDDRCEITNGSATDDNFNQIPDSCEVPPNFMLTGGTAGSGDTLAVDLVFEQTLGVGAASLSFGLCNAPGELSVTEITPDPSLLPAFFTSTSVLPDGATMGIIFGPNLFDALPVGTYDAFDVSLQLDGPAGTVSSVTFCDTVGTQPVAIVVADPFGQIYTPTTTTESITITDSTVEPCVQGDFVTPSAGISNLAFDGTTLLVGRPSGNQANFFTLDPVNGWTLEQTFSGAQSGQNFGYSVDVDGDLAVVGALFINRAFVYRRVAGTWALEAELAADVPSNIQFGISVSVSDGRIAVGAPGDDSTGLDNGAAFVFEHLGGGMWVQQAKLTDTTADFGKLGTAVNLRGELLAASTVAAVNSVASAGEVAIFRDTGVWGLEQTLVSPNPAVGGIYHFGYDAEFSPDGTRLVVGAPNETPFGTNTGRAHVFSKTDPDWTLEQSFTGNGVEIVFGQVVSLENDDLVVSASNPNSQIVANTVFTRTGSAWNFQTRFARSTPIGFGAVWGMDHADGACATVAFNAVGWVFPVPFVDGNNNGIDDICEINDGTAEDCNGNLVIDSVELMSDPSLDCDTDGTIDSCQIAADPALDCDGSTVLDSCEIMGDPSLDCNLNGVLDICDVKLGFNDCDGNSILDVCEITQDPSLDCDNDGTLDFCEITDFPGLDCNSNGILDSCEIAADPSLDCDNSGGLDECEVNAEIDCDRNGLIDSCELASDPSLDCDENGFLDVCDLAFGAPDVNGNGVLDDCESLLQIVRGDTNNDLSVDIADSILILAFLFTSGALPCQLAADVNGDDSVDIGDAIYGLAFLFSNGPEPLAPFPDCGVVNPTLPCDGGTACP